LKGNAMLYPNDTEINEITDATIDHHLVLDGTVSLEESDDETIPRIKGLVELFGDFLGD